MTTHRAWVWSAIVWMAIAGRATAETVIFADAVVEARVRFIIGKPTGDIDDSELVGITELDVSGFGVSDLGGVEALVNLEFIDFSDNFVEDITPLVGLDALVEINMSNNLIADLSPAQGSMLGNVEFLNLADNLIVSVEPLSGLENLVELDLSNNLIIDLAPLLDNEGLDAGDLLNVLGNPLSTSTVCNVILPLISRGVIVDYEGDCPGVIEGRVISQTTSAPVPGAIVRATAPLVASGIGPVTLDGDFHIANLIPGGYTLTVYAPGFEREVNFVPIANSEITRPTFRMDRITRNDVLRSGGMVTSAATGLPLAGATIEAFNGSVPIDMTFSNSVGEFELLIPVAVTAILSIEISAPGFIGEEATLNPALPAEIDAAMVPRVFSAGILQGTVLDGGSEVPMGLQDVRIILKPAGGTVAFGATSDEDGEFLIGNLAAGEYTVQVSSLDHPDEGKLRTITIVDGVNTFTITIGSLPDGINCNAAGAGHGGASGGAGDATALIAAAIAMLCVSRVRKVIHS